MLRIRALAPLAVALFASAVSAQQDFSAEGADACLKCHESEKMKGADSIAAVPVPDENLPGCRECHQKTRFHWR